MLFWSLFIFIRKMQGTYFTSKQMIKQMKIMYILTKMWGWHNTHTTQNLHIRQNSLPSIDTIYLHVHIYVWTVCAKLFVYKSCLFVACNFTVGGKVKVSKLWIYLNSSCKISELTLIKKKTNKFTNGQTAHEWLLRSSKKNPRRKVHPIDQHDF